MITNKYVPKKTSSGSLRTPVIFYAYKPGDSFEPGEVEYEKIYECFCEAYSPSMKDIEILKESSKKTNNTVTIRIRDSFGEFFPDTENYAELLDYRYKDLRFNVIDVRPDLVENDFLTILLGVVT